MGEMMNHVALVLGYTVLLIGIVGAFVGLCCLSGYGWWLILRRVLD